MQNLIKNVSLTEALISCASVFATVRAFGTMNADQPKLGQWQKDSAKGNVPLIVTTTASSILLLGRATKNTGTFDKTDTNQLSFRNAVSVSDYIILGCLAYSAFVFKTQLKDDTGFYVCVAAAALFFITMMGTDPESRTYTTPENGEGA